MTALEQLATKIRQARDLGFVPSDWQVLVEAALVETASEWLPEPAFRVITASTRSWCRRNFNRYAAHGLARRDDRGHVLWHRHARLPRFDADQLAREIADDHRGAA